MSNPIKPPEEMAVELSRAPAINVPLSGLQAFLLLSAILEKLDGPDGNEEPVALMLGAMANELTAWLMSQSTSFSFWMKAISESEDEKKNDG